MDLKYHQRLMHLYSHPHSLTHKTTLYITCVLGNGSMRLRQNGDGVGKQFLSGQIVKIL